jgi:hypothetical protein
MIGTLLFFILHLWEQIIAFAPFKIASRMYVSPLNSEPFTAKNK